MSLEVNHDAIKSLVDPIRKSLARKAEEASGGRAWAAGMAVEVGVVGVRDEYGDSMLPASPWVMKMLKELDGGS